MKSILAATDFSRHAMRAVQRAAQLAHHHRATLHLLRVLWSSLLPVLLVREGADGN